MGNRSYLLNKENKALFEANNSLPLFWIGLLNQDLLDYYQPIWLEFEELLQTVDIESEEITDFWQEWSDQLDFVITQRAFRENSAQLAAFSRRNLGEIDQLTQDFIAFLSQQLPTESDYLRISLLEFSDFYETIEAFFAFLRKQLSLLRAEEQPASKWLDLVIDQPVSEGCGFSAFEAGPKFSDFSECYRRYDPPYVVPTTSEMPKKHKGIRWLGFGLFLVAMLCLWVVFMKNASPKHSTAISISETSHSSVAFSSENEQEANSEFGVGKQRVLIDLPKVFNVLSEGDITDSNGNTWFVMESDERPMLTLEMSIKNKASQHSPQSYSLTDLGLTVSEKERVSYHDFLLEGLLRLTDNHGVVYQFETDEVKGEILFFSEEALTSEEQELFVAMIKSLEVVPSEAESE